MTVSGAEKSSSDCEGSTALTIGDDSTKLPFTPFDKPFVDIVLRSSDGIVFHALQSYLSDASQVFADMFIVAQPPPNGVDALVGEQAAQQHHVYAANEVGMQETGDVIQALVSISHPFLPPPTFASFDAIKPFLDIWPKYGLWRDVALERAMSALEPFLRDEPLRVYAYVAQFSPGEAASHLMKEAARACLRIPNLLQVDAPELDGISIHTYRRLLVYRQRCVSQLAGTLKTVAWGALRGLFGTKWTSKMNSGSCHQFPLTSDLSDGAVRLYALRTWDGLATDSYFRRYYGSMISRLLEVPHPTTVSDGQEELDAALRVAAACPSCASVAYKELPNFRDVLEKVVDGLISQVSMVEL
ncbi:hypothetical protein GY45DRAFT_1298573 [Cubamyces sp. BRFM 1775]|nr:hypothetical protein GY45DRAFT_1298573 [Cubamyces sp. BRFM 1775]